MLRPGPRNRRGKGQRGGLRLLVAADHGSQNRRPADADEPLYLRHREEYHPGSIVPAQGVQEGKDRDQYLRGDSNAIC